MRNPYDIVKRPHLTEKATKLTDFANKYIFEVDKDATKLEIRHAIEAIFKKKVRGVNTFSVRGKLRRKRTRDRGRTNSMKKAIVTLAKGEKLDLV
jgi:large subunit ribosomal protein L23